MNKGVNQRLTQGTVQRDIILAKVTLENKGHLQISHQLARHLAVKIKQVPGPASIWNNPVQPTGLRRLVLRLLLIINKEKGNSFLNSGPLPEEKKTGECP